MVSRSDRAAHWRAHVEAWRSSGQTQVAYCSEQGLSVKSLAYWLRRLRPEEGLEPSEPLTLVAVRPELDSRSACAPHPALSLHSTAGWRLEFSALPPAAWLAELLAQESRR